MFFCAIRYVYLFVEKKERYMLSFYASILLYLVGFFKVDLTDKLTIDLKPLA